MPTLILSLDAALGMGLGLSVNDFKRIAIAPKAVIVGLFAQLVMLPAVGFSWYLFFHLRQS